MNDYIAAAAGLVLLFVGGEALVRGAVALARRWGISPLVVGLVIVGAATSAPELVVSLDAALAGQPDIALGNVVGSNIANILLIMGVGALIYPLQAGKAVVFRDGAAMLLAAIVLTRVAMTGTIDRWAGGFMLAGLVVYVALTYGWERRQRTATIHAKEAEEFSDVPMPAWAAGLAVAVGVGMLVLGARWLVAGAVSIATAAGVPEAVIGLTLVAVGTSLPELATAIIAAWRRHTDVAVGNAIGSCIFNILGILAITALVTPIPVDPQIMAIDIWVMLAVTAAALPLLGSGWRLSRREGALFLAVYAAYFGWLFLGGPALVAGS